MMRPTIPSLLTLSLAASLASGCMAELDEDDIAQSGQEIVNGQLNEGDPALGMVNIGIGTCSGTMVTNRVMVTARHCVLLEDNTEIPAANISVGWGIDGRQNPIPVVSYEYHPSADIAVLELAQAAPASPIPMNTRLLDPFIGEKVRIAGYGVTGENNADSGTKRVGTTSLVDLINEATFGEIMMIGADGSKTCYGDSGGPAFMSFDGTEYLVGVTSFGTGPCELAETLDGQVRVDAYHDWIMQFVTQRDPNGLPNADGSGTGNGDGTGNGTGNPTTPIGNPNGAAGTGNQPEYLVGGCSVSGDSGAGSLAPLLLLALVLVRRRR